MKKEKMNYKTSIAISLIAISISLVAIGISIHTYYRQEKLLRDYKFHIEQPIKFINEEVSDGK